MPFDKRPDAGIMAALRGTTSLTERPLGLVRDDAELAANEIVVDAEVFDEMRRHVLGADIPYDVLSHDLSRVNYSGVRAQIAEERANWARLGLDRLDR